MRHNLRMYIFSATGIVAVIVLAWLVLVMMFHRAQIKHAKVLFESGDFIGARSEYEKIITAKPENFAAHFGLGMSLCAETIHKNELGLAKPEDWYPAIYHITIAMNMQESRQVRETLAILHFNLAVSFREEGSDDKALRLLEMAVTYDPKLLKALNLLGAMYHERNDSASAEEYYRKAVAVRPDYAMSWFNLGALLWAQKQYTGSVEYFQKAVSLDPENEYFQSWLIKARARTGVK